MTTYYKVLNEDGAAFHGGNGKWFLPTNGKPGDWMPKIEGELKPCVNGYHIVSGEQLIGWLGPAIFEAEVRGEIIPGDDKVMCREARLLRKFETWDEKTNRLLSSDCLEHAAKIYSYRYPESERPQQAIDVARRYAHGKATIEDLTVEWIAVWNSVWAHRGLSEWDTELKWQTKRLFQYLNGEIVADEKDSQ